MRAQEVPSSMRGFVFRKKFRHFQNQFKASDGGKQHRTPIHKWQENKIKLKEESIWVWQNYTVWWGVTSDTEMLWDSSLFLTIRKKLHATYCDGKEINVCVWVCVCMYVCVYVWTHLMRWRYPVGRETVSLKSDGCENAFYQNELELWLLWLPEVLSSWYLVLSGHHKIIFN